MKLFNYFRNRRDRKLRERIALQYMMKCEHNYTLDGYFKYITTGQIPESTISRYGSVLKRCD